jgi:hypothetical protein
VSTGDIVPLTICVVLALACARVLPSVWRNERGLHMDTPAPWWPWGGPSWRTFVRIWPTFAVTLFVWLATVVATGIAPDGSAADTVATAVGGTASILMIVFWFTVALLNRPRLLVVPHLRDQPGLLDERRGRQPTPTPPPAEPPVWHRAGPRGG